MGRGEASEAFVARIWLERRSNGEPVWRGHIRHVQSQQERYFRKLAEMRDFMEQVADAPCVSLANGPNDDSGPR